jgi:hypothetical protein
MVSKATSQAFTGSNELGAGSRNGFRLVLVLAALASASMVACGGASEAARTSPRSPTRASAGAEPATEPMADSYAGGSKKSASSAPAGESMSRSDSASRPSERERRAEESRPGLATEWGEARVSRVHETSFDREADPFYTATFRYNDAKGVRAMDSDGVRVRRGEFPVEAMIVGESNRMFPTRLLANNEFLVTGDNGARYTIIVRNRSGERVEAVASVDGLDVLDGEAARLSKRGYVIEAGDTLAIEGFRQSQNQVAAFRFGTVGESYAASKGETRNVGVIGLAVFADRNGRLRDEAGRRMNATPFADEGGPWAKPPRR